MELPAKRTASEQLFDVYKHLSTIMPNSEVIIDSDSLFIDGKEVVYDWSSVDELGAATDSEGAYSIANMVAIAHDGYLKQQAQEQKAKLEKALQTPPNGFDRTKCLRTYFWSRIPGKFVNEKTGQALPIVTDPKEGPVFRGTVGEWNETLPLVIGNLATDLGEGDPSNIIWSLGASRKLMEILRGTMCLQPGLPSEETPGPFGISEGLLINLGAKVFTVDENLISDNELLLTGALPDGEPVFGSLIVLDMTII